MLKYDTPPSKFGQPYDRNLVFNIRNLDSPLKEVVITQSNPKKYFRDSYIDVFNFRRATLQQVDIRFTVIKPSKPMGLKILCPDGRTLIYNARLCPNMIVHEPVRY